jgi:hypothetical protein
LAAAGILAIALAVVIGAGSLSGAPRPAAGARSSPDPALRRYVQDLQAVMAPGGQVVETDMKPSLRAFAQGQVSPADMGARARSWQIALQRVKSRFLALLPPAEVGGATPLFAAALDQYLAAARFGEQASEAGPDQRPVYLEQAAQAGRSGDQKYNAAAKVVQDALRAQGSSPDPNLPGG